MPAADRNEPQIPSANPFARLGMERDARVLVVGLGKTGYSVARFLSRQGFSFAVADSREKPPCLRELQEHLPDAGVFLGGFRTEAFRAATHLVVSPGVALDTPEIAAAAQRGVPVLGDLDLFACVARAPIVAITGANGKSTVTTLVGLMAEADGKRTRTGGNLGTPMLDLLDAAAELYVLELSSFQLERSTLLEATAATVLNISPDHLDRYPDLAAYAAAKRRIFRGGGLMVLNRDDPAVAAMAEPGRRCRWFGLQGPEVDYGLGRLGEEEWLLRRGEPLLRLAEVRLQGRHNIANALAAVALADAVGVTPAAMVQVLRQFRGLDHRMQWVAEVDGVAWINDSKATNVGACAAALAGLERRAVLIAGGDGKGADFTLLRPVVRDKVRAAVVMGRDAGLLEAALRDLIPLVRAQTMREAVQAARALAQPGDVVLLAPACSSLDQYKDYQERGRIFMEAVRSMQS
ncbi:UDP-N-acetylmuramoyl-L-alanine--D-glutamate ligase [Candidatus Methylocalor cossyra]|uniref:UDP-N-acetylmuramoylalanine--D-glutamate ligase n=1 Tax=Candidatus Methylocalor cossyra TaxID=3108543 RepID=A0ABM9NHT6_9GAMM